MISIEVGKTCLIWRFAADQFSTRTMNTIGIDFKIKYVKIDDMRIKLQVMECNLVNEINFECVTFYRTWRELTYNLFFA